MFPTVVDVSRERVKETDMDAKLSIAEADGYAAYGEDRMRVPALSPVVTPLIEGMEVGAGAADIFSAFLKGYDRAADEECARILAS